MVKLLKRLIIKRFWLAIKRALDDGGGSVDGEGVVRYREFLSENVQRMSRSDISAGRVISRPSKKTIYSCYSNTIICILTKHHYKVKIWVCLHCSYVLLLPWSEVILKCHY